MECNYKQENKDIFILTIILSTTIVTITIITTIMTIMTIVTKRNNNYYFITLPNYQIPGQSPYAVVEMGGASSQVSQAAPTQADADAIPEEYKFSFDIEGIA